jgi:hypothetical protein
LVPTRSGRGHTGVPNSWTWLNRKLSDVPVLGEFWKSVGGKIADRWAAASAAAVVFWLGGLLAWIYGHGGLQKLIAVAEWFNLQSGVVQVAAVIFGLLSMTASALVAQRLTFPALRLLEGYWPSWLRPIRRRLIARVQQRAKIDDAAWQELYPKVQSRATADPEQLASFVRLDQARRRRPNNPNGYMPTRVGNVLRAAETWPADKYGLDAVTSRVVV